MRIKRVPPPAWAVEANPGGETRPPVTRGPDRSWAKSASRPKVARRNTLALPNQPILIHFLDIKNLVQGFNELCKSSYEHE